MHSFNSYLHKRFIILCRYSLYSCKVTPCLSHTILGDKTNEFGARHLSAQFVSHTAHCLVGHVDGAE